MIRFGPSGNSDSFYEKYKSTIDVPKWLAENNLNTYEYGFTRGINIGAKACAEIKKAFEPYNIPISVHAPYYINFATTDDIMAEKSYGYIVKSLEMMKYMGAKKLVFHPGSLMKQSREQALARVLERLKVLIKLLENQGYNDFILCPETMGKHGQVGTVEEVVEMCKIDERIMPTLDFGHINSFSLGGIKTKEDYEKIFDSLEKGLGTVRARNVHIHFSKIEYGDKGELKHLTFDTDEKGYGPEFAPLAEVLIERNISANIICESHSYQTEDAVKMKNIYDKMKNH